MAHTTEPGLLPLEEMCLDCNSTDGVSVASSGTLTSLLQCCIYLFWSPISPCANNKEHLSFLIWATGLRPGHTPLTMPPL